MRSKSFDHQRSVALVFAALMPIMPIMGSCDDDPAGRTMPQSSDLCGVIAGYIPQCGDLTPCEQGLLRDCKALENALTEPTSAALISCVRQFGAPAECLSEAVEATPSSPAFENYVTTLCLECGNGAGECQQEVLAGEGNETLLRMSRLARVVHPQLINGLARECTVIDECGAPFESCAVAYMSRFLPSETAECVVGTVLNGASNACGGTGGSGEGSGTDTGAGTGAEADEGTEVCNVEGCPCLFPEECDQAAGLGCVEEFCTPIAVCTDDPHEPNDKQSEAKGLPGVTDSDSNAKKVSGELNGSDDVDWFTFNGDDAPGGQVDPAAKLSEPDLELCVHAVCKNDPSKTKVECPANTQKKPSESGLPGCCGLSLESGVELKFGGCSSLGLGSEDAIVFVRVGGGETNMCLPYTMTYHF